MNVNNLVIRAAKFNAQFMTILESGWAMICFISVQILLFFLPIQFNIYFVGTLIVADVFTALAAMFMLCKRDAKSLREAFSLFYSQWTSKRAFDSIPKFIWYSILVILAFMVGTIFQEPMKVANLATGIIAYVEIRSIIENGDKAFGTNIWELCVDGVKKFFKLK